MIPVAETLPVFRQKPFSSLSSRLEKGGLFYTGNVNLNREQEKNQPIRNLFTPEHSSTGLSSRGKTPNSIYIYIYISFLLSKPNAHVADEQITSDKPPRT
jgi:hypothetical protein